MNEPQKIDSRAERYELLSQALSDGIFDWDISGDSVYFSPAWKAQLGYADDELDNTLTTWEERLHPEDRDATLSALRLFLDGHALHWDQEFRLRHRDGGYRWIRARGTAVRQEDSGRVARIVGLHRDVTDLRKASSDRGGRYSHPGDALPLLPDPYLVVDRNGIIADAHATSAAALFTSREQVLGRQLGDVLPDGAHVSLASALQEARLTRSPTSFEFTVALPHDHCGFEARISSSDDGEYAVILLRDITDQLRIEQDQQRQLRQLAGLARINQLATLAADAQHLAKGAAVRIVKSLPEASRAYCQIALDGQEFSAGIKADMQGQRFRGLLFDGNGQRGDVTVTVDRGYVLQGDEQHFVNRAAQAISLRLRGDHDREIAETFRRIVAGTQDQVALVDRDLHYRVVNPAYAAARDLAPQELVGLPVREILDAAAYERFIAYAPRVLEEGEQVQFQEWRPAPDGRRYMNVLYAPYHHDGEIQGIIKSCHDISALHEAHAKLRRAAQVFSNSAEAVMMTELDGTITDVNDAFCEITGYAEHEVINQRPTLIQSERHDQAFFDEMFDSIAVGGRWRGEIWNRRRNGEVFPCLMTISVVADERGAPNGYVGVFADITAMKDNEHRLEALANHDPLTGLPNRMQLVRTLDRNIEASRRNGDPFTVMYIDFDHFKDVNDSFGHQAGDQLLCSATRRLKGVLRANDVLARVGGDEFVLVLPGMHGAGNASLIAQKILDVTLQPFEVEGGIAHISASIGIASFPADAQDAETLLRNADAAMYQVKEQGRSDWRCYTLAMTEQATRHLRLLAGLRAAIDQRELSMRYQPQRDLENHRLRGLEANPHWVHPDLGTVPMAEFMSAAEEGGLIRHIDNWALDEVCAQLQRWRNDGHDEVRIALNISPRSLQSQHFIDDLAQRLKKYQIPGSALELEINETALLTELEGDGSRMRALAELGVSLAIDDFGSGYSNLAELSRRPVRRLKIDARFVREMRDDSQADSVTRAVLALGRTLGLQVVAQGLDGAELGSRLLEYGATLAQGQHCGAAMDADEIARLLDRES